MPRYAKEGIGITGLQVPAIIEAVLFPNLNKLISTQKPRDPLLLRTLLEQKSVRSVLLLGASESIGDPRWGQS